MAESPAKVLETREVLYHDPRTGMRFYANPDDGPDAYDVVVPRAGQADFGFYIPNRVLGDLTQPAIDSDDVVTRLINMNPKLNHNLQAADISPNSLHRALLQLRIKSLEHEVGDLIKQQMARRTE